MNIELIYELRSCLRRTMIAGIGLIMADFRLQRVRKELEKLKETSPVLEKIIKSVDELLAEDFDNKEATLMDTITLVDALLCTQGEVSVEAELTSIEVYGCGEVVAPYSLIKRIEDTLNTPQNPGYLFARDAYSKVTHLFEDYRLRAAVVKAFGAEERYLAKDYFFQARRRGDASWIGLLQKDFRPEGGEEMAFRVNVLAAVAGKQCNDFYLQMLSEADEVVKVELIYALRHCQDNTDILLELVKTESDEAKKRAIYALARMEDTRAEAYFVDMYVKTPIEALQYLKATTVKWACKLVGQELLKLLQICEDEEYCQKEHVFNGEDLALLDALVDTMEGKSGPEICEVYRKAFQVGNICYWDDEDDCVRAWEKKIPLRRAYYTWKALKAEYQAKLGELMAYLLLTSIRLNPCQELCELAKELYQNHTMEDRNENYLAAVLTAMFFEKKNITPWLRERMFRNGNAGVEKDDTYWKAIVFAFDELIYDRKRGGFVLGTEMRDGLTYYGEKTVHPVEGVINNALMDLLIEYDDMEADKILTFWVNTSDRETTQKLEKYFYERALTGPIDGRSYYWSGLRRTGCKTCEGLLEECARRRNSHNPYDFSCYSLAGWMMHPMPGNVESFDAETERVFQLLSSGEIRLGSFKERRFKADIAEAREFVRLGYKEMGI